MQIYPDPPSDLRAGPVKLFFDKRVEIEPGGELVPFYHFKIIGELGKIVGHINFKTGDTEHIIQYAGHIGFQIIKEYRGHSYAYWACMALAPFVQSVYGKVILTCDPENIASRKTIEKLPATFINEVAVPLHEPSYQSGSRLKRRYQWEP